jgi:hypothetical protein
MAEKKNFFIIAVRSVALLRLPHVSFHCSVLFVLSINVYLFADDNVPSRAGDELAELFGVI